MTPEQYVQERAAKSGSSFYYAFLFLPRERRAAITAFYAFCREVDDVVDEVHEPGVAAAKLAWWRAEVAAAFGGRPTHPVTKALAPHFANREAIWAWTELYRIVAGCQSAFILYDATYDIPSIGFHQHALTGVTYTHVGDRWLSIADQGTLLP